MGFFDVLRRKRTQSEEELWSRYVDLLERGDKITNNEAEEMTALLRTLGMDERHAEVHRLVLDTAAKLDEASVGDDEKHKAATEAAEKSAAYEKETDRILAERKVEAQRLRLAAAHLTSAHMRVLEAQRKAREIRTKFPRLFGDLRSDWNPTQKASGFSAIDQTAEHHFGSDAGDVEYSTITVQRKVVNV